MSNFHNYLSDDWVNKNNLTIDTNWKNVLKKIEQKTQKTISVDGDYSVNWKNLQIVIRKSISARKKIIFLNFYECIFSYKELNIFFKKNLLDADPLFGKISNHGINKILDRKKTVNFIKEFKRIFKKIIIVKIPGEKNSYEIPELKSIARKYFNVSSEKNIILALKKLSSNQKKTIVIFGSLYLAGAFLKKN